MKRVDWEYRRKDTVLLLATILWLVITNINDPVQYKTFSDIQVTIKNEYG